MWDEICCNLEDARASMVITAVDYAKSFNRLCLQHCLRAFARKGASTETLRILASFLSNRTMSVRVHNTWSRPLPVHGGVPQGSIVGVLLFNISTDDLEDDQEGHDQREFVDSDCGEEPSLSTLDNSDEPVNGGSLRSSFTGRDGSAGQEIDCSSTAGSTEGSLPLNHLGWAGSTGPESDWGDHGLLDDTTFGPLSPPAFPPGLNPYAPEFHPQESFDASSASVLGITDELLHHQDANASGGWGSAYGKEFVARTPESLCGPAIKLGITDELLHHQEANVSGGWGFAYGEEFVARTPESVCGPASKLGIKEEE